jgi:polyvinyl alcohol dehydrogenase (cytochrome)
MERRSKQISLRNSILLGFSGLVLSGAMSIATAQSNGARGAALYAQHCAQCHDAALSHAPMSGALKQLPAESVLGALQAGGAMEVQGRNLSSEEHQILAEFLTGKKLGTGSSEAQSVSRCANPLGEFSASLDQPHWNGWGVDLENSRYQPPAMARLTASQVPLLKLKWSFAFPNAVSAEVQPTIMGHNIFVSGANQTVYSLNAKTGCINWTFGLGTSSRTAIEIAQANSKGRYFAYLGDLSANVYALDAAAGKLIWKVNLDQRFAAHITGALKVFDGVVYVPLVMGEDSAAADPKFECCKTSGALVALDAATGRLIWRTDTIREPVAQTGVNDIGTPMWGPSGASIWSSPTLDIKRHAVYVTTGDNHSAPATDTSDAVIAFDMTTGSIIWSRQFTVGDTGNLACYSLTQTNCPPAVGPDFDFGASPVLVKLRSGKRLLIAGQKSGVVHAIDPDNRGKIVWQTRTGLGGLFGGIQWGIASDGDAVFAPVSDVVINQLHARDPAHSIGALHFIRTIGGGLFALDAATGKMIWKAAPVPCAVDRTECSPGQLAAVTLIQGVVFSGSLDGHIRAYSSTTGAILWDFDTEQNFNGVNGVPGHGGSLNFPGPVVVDGMLYVASGYGTNGGVAGNVLLAFGVE